MYNYQVDEICKQRDAVTSEARLRVITDLDLGERSECAKRVLQKRVMRREYMSKGLSFEEACLLVNNQN